jgi:hypothetical protein
MIRLTLSFVFFLACFTVSSALPQRAVLDFDGDNRTDYAVVRDDSGTLNWYLQRSMSGFAAQAWGITADFLVPGDYDGDLKWDIAVWRAGVFYILRSSDGALQVVQFGQNGDDPRVTQDFDGDGRVDPAVVRSVASRRVWYILRSSLGFTGVTFGNSPSDETIRGDFDGDGMADVAVYRKDSGSPAHTFFVLRSSDGAVQAQTFGHWGTDFIVPADFDEDGKTDYAVWRFTTGTWYWLHSSDNSFHALNFGQPFLDVPVPGDYDGDGQTDQALWRPTDSTFYLNGSMAGFVAFPFGAMNDVPPAWSLQVR